MCKNVSAHAVTGFHFNISHIFSRLQVLETESSSAVDGSGDSINRGRLPTPKLRTMQTVQRTHHDRTTPATGIKPIRHHFQKFRSHRPMKMFWVSIGFTDSCGFLGGWYIHVSPWTYTSGISQQFHYDWRVCSQNNWLQASCLLEKACYQIMNYIEFIVFIVTWFILF